MAGDDRTSARWTPVERQIAAKLSRRDDLVTIVLGQC
jgi:hypothetical protein